MTLASLLILAAALGTGTAAPEPGSRSPVPQGPSPSLDRPDAAGRGQAARPLKAHESSVTCTLRVIAADPKLDARMVLRVAGSRLDRIVRDEAAACRP